jgi:hypothetical protein
MRSLSIIIGSGIQSREIDTPAYQIPHKKKAALSRGLSKTLILW